MFDGYKFRVIITDAEPDIYFLCGSVDLPYNGDLIVAFFHITLVNALGNADSVNLQLRP